MMTDYISWPETIKKETYLKILPVYLAEIKDLKSSIQDLNTIKEQDLLAQLCHKLKGGASNYGALQLAEYSQSLNEKFKQHQLNVSDKEVAELVTLIDLTIESANELLND